MTASKPPNSHHEITLILSMVTVGVRLRNLPLFISFIPLIATLTPVTPPSHVPLPPIHIMTVIYLPPLAFLFHCPPPPPH